MNSDFENNEVNSRGKSRKRQNSTTSRIDVNKIEYDRVNSVNNGKNSNTLKSGDLTGSSDKLEKKLVNRENSSGDGPARRNKKVGNSKQLRLKKIIIIAILEVIVLCGIFSYAYVLKQYNKIQRPDFTEDKVKNMDLSEENIKKMEGYWNIAVFGVDSRNSSVGKGNNSDVIMIASINRDTGAVKLVSVFRDTYLNTGSDSYNKINSAYAKGGPEQAVSALNQNLDLNITQYITFNWKAVATGINILGGVDVDISKAELYYINSYITETVKSTGIGSVQIKGTGNHHLDGIQAVAYARLRYMDNDFARTERQREIVQQAFTKAKKANITKLNSLLGNMLEMVATNLTWQDGLDVIGEIGKYTIADTGGFPFARGDANMGKKGACVIPQTLETNVSDLHKFLFGDEDYVPSDTVKKISKKIAADSGMYNEGDYVDHVSTDGGYIPTTKDAAKESTEETNILDDVADKETDENGDLIEQTSAIVDDENKLNRETLKGGESGPGVESRPSKPGSTTEENEETTSSSKTTATKTTIESSTTTAETTSAAKVTTTAETAATTTAASTSGGPGSGSSETVAAKPTE